MKGKYIAMKEENKLLFKVHAFKVVGRVTQI